MRLIVDTHILLWTIAEHAKLPARARDLLIDPAHEKFASAASFFEITVKYALRRGAPGDMPIDGQEALTLAVQSGFVILPIEASDAGEVGNLPNVGHADPFDRLLIAQAAAGAMRLLTHDRALAAYGDHVLLV